MARPLAFRSCFVETHFSFPNSADFFLSLMPSVWTYKSVDYCFYCIEFRKSYYHSTSRSKVGTTAFFFQEAQIRISAQIPLRYIEVIFL